MSSVQTRTQQESFDPPPAGGQETARLFWDVLSSIRTTIVLVWILALMLGVASVIKQNATIPEIVAAYPFAAAQAMLGLEMNRFWTAWPTLLVLLLLLVNAVGLMLRHGWGVTKAERARHSWVGPGVVTRQKTFQHSKEVSLKAIGAVLKKEEKGWRQTESQLWIVRGLWLEGCLLLLLGLITMVVGGVVDSYGGLDARLTVKEAVSTEAFNDLSAMKMKVKRDGYWLDQTPPFSMQCLPPDPLDMQRQRTCAVSMGQKTHTISLGFHEEVELLGLHFRLLSERSVPLQGSPTVLLETPEGKGLRLLRGEQGHGYRLTSGVQYTTFVGPDGPLIVKKAPSKPARLLVPTVTPGLPANTASLKVVGVPAWEMQFSVQRRPSRYLFGVGFLVLLVGLLAMWIFPHLGVVLWQEGSVIVLMTYSFNRTHVVEQALETFEKVLLLGVSDGEEA
jgi:hypothetical protein